MARLGDVCSIYTGTGFPVQYQGNTQGQYPFYKVGDISKNVSAGKKYLEFADNYIERDVVNKIKGTIIPKRTVVFAKIGEAVKLNRRAITLRDCLVDNNAMGIAPNEDVLSLDYFFHYMCQLRLETLAEATTVPSVKKSIIENLNIPLPNIHDQQKISEKMNLLDHLISLRKQQLAKLDELVKARFVELFGDPVNNSKGLLELTLPELGEFGRGVSKHRPRNDPKLLGGKYPLIQTGEVANSELYITSYENTYSEFGLKQSKLWQAGTLCITIAANIAKTAILTFDACFPDSVVGFKANDRTNNIFIHYWFSFFQAILEAQAPESAQKNINLKILSELKIIVPPIEQQNEFVAFVKQTDKSKLAIKQSLDKLETLKKALMQEYFG